MHAPKRCTTGLVLPLLAAVCTLAAWTAGLGQAAVADDRANGAGRSDPAAANRAAVPQAAAAGDSWPLFRGSPQADGVAASTLPQQPELLWKQSFRKDNLADAFEATAVIHEGTIYLGGLNGTLFALELATGQTRWTFDTGSSIKASAAVRNGLVYVGDLDGRFHCLDAATGQRRWVHEAAAEIDNGANFYQDTVLYGSQDATLYCLEAATGKLRWKHQIADQIRCFPAIAGDRTFIAGCDGDLHIIHLKDGQSLARVSIEGPTGCTPAVRGDIAYVGTEGDVFFAIDHQKAEVVWRARPPRAVSFRSSAAVTRDVVVVGNRGRAVLGLAPADGKVLWTYNAGAAVNGSPVIVGDRALVGTTRGVLVALDLARGEAVWQFQAGGSFESSPAVAAGRLVIGNTDGTVFCFGQK